MEVSTNFVNYEEYKKKQESLAKLLEGSGKIVSALNMQQYAKNLESLGQKVHNENFKVQVVGAFKNGKSTFINSLLGEEILPAYTIPTTAVINEIKWGPEKKAVLTDAQLLERSGIVNESRYRTKTVPAAGALLKPEDSPEKQTSFEV